MKTQKVNHMAEETNNAPKSVEVEKTYVYFDKETLEQKDEKVKITFTPAATLDEAMNRVGGDQETILKALNAFAQRNEFRNAKAEVLKKGINTKILMGVLRPFRAMPPYNALDKNRKEQTKQLLAMLKSAPVILAAIIAQSDATANSDDDDDDSESAE